MTQALDPIAYVYEGVWVNWSKGNLRGLTLTLSPEKATFLTNTLSLLVTYCGSQFWSILRFFIHQVWESASKNKDQGLIHDKYQTILRNTPTAFESARLTIALLWSSPGAYAKTVPAIVNAVAFISITFFFIAATFSDKLAGAGATALSRSPFCGPWNSTYFDIVSNGPNPTNSLSLALAAEFGDKEMSDTQLSQQYAQQCYATDNIQNSTSYPSCDSQKDFRISRLPFNTTHGDACPFSPIVCSAGVQTIEVRYLHSQKAEFYSQNVLHYVVAAHEHCSHSRQ
jgi:hypothetical protein